MKQLSTFRQPTTQHKHNWGRDSNPWVEWNRDLNLDLSISQVANLTIKPSLLGYDRYILLTNRVFHSGLKWYFFCNDMQISCGEGKKKKKKINIFPMTNSCEKNPGLPFHWGWCVMITRENRGLVSMTLGILSSPALLMGRYRVVKTYSTYSLRHLNTLVSWRCTDELKSGHYITLYGSTFSFSLKSNFQLQESHNMVQSCLAHLTSFSSKKSKTLLWPENRGEYDIWAR